MKKAKYIIVLFLSALGFSHCSEEKFLDIKPTDRISDAIFWKTEEDFLSALNGVYNSYAQHSTASFGLNTLANTPSGDLHWNVLGDLNRLESLNLTANNGEISSVYSGLNGAIARANTVLSRIASANINATLKDRIIGEAKFLRAFGYFNLARGWGNVPLITYEVTAATDPNIPNTPAAEVFAQVAKDFTEAAEALPVAYDDANVGRATKGAALAYLAYTYMYLKDWTKAKAATEQVFDISGLNAPKTKYDLVPNYKDVFAMNNENNEESMFEIQYRVENLGWNGTNGHQLGAQQGPPGAGEAVAQLGGWGNQAPTAKLAAAFEPGDERKTAQILEVGQTYSGYTLNAGVTPTNLLFTKWWKEGGGDYSSGGTNLPQLRFAEVLLNYAEILVELNQISDAYTHINRVRDRAGLGPKSPSTKEVAMDDIMQERRVETAAEYNWWYHLTRTRRAVDFVKKEYNRTMQEHMYLFPIPQSQRDLNKKLEQNPGYGI